MCVCIHAFEGIAPMISASNKSSIDCLLEEMKLFLSFPLKAIDVSPHMVSIFTQ